jgi:hypothetical protein
LIVQVVAVAATVPHDVVTFPAVAVTTYPVMGLPPVLVGATQVTTTEPAAPEAVTPLGATGGAAVAEARNGAEGADINDVVPLPLGVTVKV